MNEDKPKLITKEERERITEADRLVSFLYSDLEDYRKREGLEEVEFINLATEARKMLLDAGAQFVNYDLAQSLGPGRWGDKTTMCVPPEWILKDEDQIKKSFDVFDFVKSQNEIDDIREGKASFIISPKLVFKRGVGHPIVCVYELKDTKQNTEHTLLARLFDYVAAISNQMT